MRERRPSKKVSKDAADNEALAELHKEVAMNPFGQSVPTRPFISQHERSNNTNTLTAHALATPIRQCNLTFARLPSHYLLPFATVIEKSPPANKGQPPRVKARPEPGLRSEHSGVTLGQNSYVVNRQDMVRHLSRKRHWTPLATERHKVIVAQMAHRSPSAQKLVESLWVWEDKVQAAAELLEGRVVKALMEAFEVVKTDGSLPTAREEWSAFALVFGDASQGENADRLSGSDSDITTYDLSALLPAETLGKLQADHDMPSTPIFVPKSTSAVHAQLALDKLKAHKEADEVTKPISTPRRSSPSNLTTQGE